MTINNERDTSILNERDTSRLNERDTSRPFEFREPRRRVTQLATPQMRLVAFFLDGIIFSLSFGIGWCAWFFITAKDGATPGHFLMGQKVVSSTGGEVISWQKMVLREIFVKGILMWVIAGFTMMLIYILDGAFLFTEKRRTIHDLLLGTTVIQSSEETILTKFQKM